MLTAITYRMRTPPIITVRTASENSTSVPLSSPSLWAGSDGGSSRTTEPGPELGIVLFDEIFQQFLPLTRMRFIMEER